MLKKIKKKPKNHKIEMLNRLLLLRMQDIEANPALSKTKRFSKAGKFNDLSIGELATALLVGYEVDMTPRERIAYEYNYHQKRAKEEKSGREKWVGKGYVRGVQRTLKNLNITVKGVNDHD